MNKEKILQEFEEFAKAKMGGNATLLNELGLIDFLSKKLNQLQDEHTEELKEQAERADDHFASVVAGIMMDIIKMKKKTERKDNNQLQAEHDEGYNRALDDVINYLLNGKEDNI